MSKILFLSRDWPYFLQIYFFPYLLVSPVTFFRLQIIYNFNCAWPENSLCSGSTKTSNPESGNGNGIMESRNHGNGNGIRNTESVKEGSKRSI